METTHKIKKIIYYNYDNDYSAKLCQMALKQSGFLLNFKSFGSADIGVGDVNKEDIDTDANTHGEAIIIHLRPRQTISRRQLTSIFKTKVPVYGLGHSLWDFNRILHFPWALILVEITRPVNPLTRTPVKIMEINPRSISQSKHTGHGSGNQFDWLYVGDWTPIMREHLSSTINNFPQDNTISVYVKTRLNKEYSPENSKKIQHEAKDMNVPEHLTISIDSSDFTCNNLYQLSNRAQCGVIVSPDASQAMKDFAQGWVKNSDYTVDDFADMMCKQLNIQLLSQSSKKLYLSDANTIPKPETEPCERREWTQYFKSKK
jgi:hypothetical protein